VLNRKAVQATAIKIATLTLAAFVLNLGLYYAPMLLAAVGILIFLGLVIKFIYETECERIESMDRLNKAFDRE
jgi:hypothetical protein